jgi:hypothetical protein
VFLKRKKEEGEVAGRRKKRKKGKFEYINNKLCNIT